MIKSIGEMRINVQLSPDELAEKKSELVEIVEAGFRLEADKKEEAARMRELIKTNKADQQAATLVISNGVEMREVEIGERVSGNMIQIIRLDTEEVVKTRRASQAEREQGETDRAREFADADAEPEPEPDAEPVEDFDPEAEPVTDDEPEPEPEPKPKPAAKKKAPKKRRRKRAGPEAETPEPTPEPEPTIAAESAGTTSTDGPSIAGDEATATADPWDSADDAFDDLD